MAETVDRTYKVKTDNTADTTPNSVAVVNDGTADRQIVVLGAGDGTTTINDGSPANPLNAKLTDGTNTANVVAGDSGFNGIAVASATKTYTFTTSASGAQTILANTNCEGYSWIEVVYTSVGSGLALTGQFSTASGGTYVNGNAFVAVSNTFTSAGAIGTSANTIYGSGVHGNFFQLAVTALTSGTFAGTVTLHANSPAMVSMFVAQNGNWNVGSNSATGSAVPANGFYEALQARTSSPTAVTNGQLVGLTGSVMGEALVATGGLVTTVVAVSASNTVVKATSGRLCNILVTTTGVTAMLIYDNSTTNSGTIIGQLPASAAVGSIYQFNMPAANGITVAGSATNPAVTISWI